MGIADLIYPQRCRICGEYISYSPLKICNDCYKEFPYSYYWSWSDNPGYHILNSSVNVECVISLMYYNSQSVWKELISDFKYKGDRKVGIELSSMLAQKMIDHNCYKEFDYILPVPLHWIKILKRGYNQSLIIAKTLSDEMGIPFKSSVLKRVRYSKTQTAKNREDRAKVIYNTYVVSEKCKKMIENRHILLVDDVMTTGATTVACAKELLKVSGCRVSVLTLATVE